MYEIFFPGSVFLLSIWGWGNGNRRTVPPPVHGATCVVASPGAQSWTYLVQALQLSVSAAAWHKHMWAVCCRCPYGQEPHVAPLQTYLCRCLCRATATSFIQQMPSSITSKLMWSCLIFPLGAFHGCHNPNMALAERIQCPVLHFGAGFPWEKGKCPNREAMGSCCG